MPETPIKPGTNLLDQSSNMVASDRARRISSLHRTVDDLVQEQNKKRLQTSNEVNALTKQQKEMMMQLDLERTEFTSETAKGYNSVLKGLGRTIESLATGVKSITIDTGKATSQAIGQYGKAISEDISINKTNTIAMALSRATPLFGYFAAKFMETDVFQGAAARIKDKVGSAMTEGLSKAGSGIANVFKKGKKIVNEERHKAPATVSDLEGLQKSIEGAAPKLQEGGYIKQGGIVEVHAAEVVTPIDKLLKQIDEAKSADISRKLDKTLSLMSQNLLKLETVVVEREEQQGSIVQTFIKEFQNVRDTKQEGHQKRLLRAILELKVGLIGMTSRMRIAWQRTLLQHPAFRNMLMFSDIMKSAIISPIQFLFGIRGGYAGDVRGATRTHNVFLKTSNIMALLYTTLMPKIDDLVIYTKAAAEAITGGPITGSKQVTFTMFDKIREAMTSRSIVSPMSKLFDYMVDKLDLDRETMAEAGITGIGGFAKPGRVMKRAGITKKNIMGSMFEKPKIWADMSDNISKMRKMKEEQEEREGPHSPSMADNISKTALASGEQVEETKGVRKGIKKLRGKIWDMVLIGFGFIKNIFGKGFSKFMSLMTSLGTFFGASKLGKLVKGAVGKIPGLKGLIKTKSPITGLPVKPGGIFAKGAAAGAAKKGFGARALGLGGKALGLGGKLAGAAGGALVGSGMGLWDAFQAIRDPEGFMGGFLVRGLAAFVGGRDTGLAGAKRGVWKGAALGAALGSVVPGIGTLIGGAIGAAAGGILGFVGGKKLSEGITKSLSTIKDMVKGVWNIVIFPYKMLKEGLKSAWILLKWGFKNTLGKVYQSFKDWLQKPGIIQTAMKWIGGMMSTIVGYIKMPFIWIGKKLKALFGDEIWSKMAALAKEVAYNLMFPIIGIRKVFTYLKNQFVEKISNLPVIGAIFKKVMSTVKDIHEGTLASKLDAALNETGSDVGLKSVTMPSYGTGTVRTIDSRNQAAIQKYMDTETKKYGLDAEARKRGYDNLSKQLGSKIQEGSRQTTAAIINNSNVMSSTSNQSVSSQGGWDEPAAFGSGNGFARDVTRCNIR